MKHVIRVSILWACSNLLFASLVSAASIGLQVVPSSLTVVLGQSVTADVVVSQLGRPPAVGAFDIDLAFDAAVLEPTGVNFGVLLGNPALGEVLTDFRLSLGLVNFAAVSLLSNTNLYLLQPTSFTLATVSFTAIGSGTTALLFTDALVDDEFGNKLDVIPEPASVLLMGWALLRFAARRRRSNASSPI